MEHPRFTLFPWGLLALLLLQVACKKEPERVSVDQTPAETVLKEGDIVFRRGMGVTSQMVLIADTEGTYSHIGIVIKDSGTWKVVHAVPGEPDFEGDPDRVKLERIQVFFEKEKAARGAVMRVKGDTVRNRCAAQRALRLFESQIRFDHSYDLSDSTEMYCTELIDFVFRHENIDLTEGRISQIHVPGISGTYVLPSDIQKSERLELIYSF